MLVCCCGTCSTILGATLTRLSVPTTAVSPTPIPPTPPPVKPLPDMRRCGVTAVCVPGQDLDLLALLLFLPFVSSAAIADLILFLLSPTVLLKQRRRV